MPADRSRRRPSRPRARSAVLAALGDPSRLRLLASLGTPANVTELVARTGLGQANVSSHLARLRTSGLVSGVRRGRFVEYRLASPSVAQLVESFVVLAGPPPAAVRSTLAEARTCYDHLAGRLGVAIFDALRARAALTDAGRPDGSLALGQSAGRAFRTLGVDLDVITPGRRRLAYKCLDWTERRPHLGGVLGAAIAIALSDAGYVRRRRGSRALDVAPRAWRAIARVRSARIRSTHRLR